MKHMTSQTHLRFWNNFFGLFDWIIKVSLNKADSQNFLILWALYLDADSRNNRNNFLSENGAVSHNLWFGQKIKLMQIWGMTN